MFITVFHHLRELYYRPKCPRILIYIDTGYDDSLPKTATDDSLSKTGTGRPFSITLKAVVEAANPITIDPDRTLLDRESLALFKRGLTFTNVKTGKVALRPTMFVCRGGSDGPLTEERTIELHSHKYDRPYAVKHTFIPPTPASLETRRTVSRDGESFIEHPAVWCQLPAHSDGLEVGETYAIGLGEDLTQVSWWKWGRKWAVFFFPFCKRSRNPGRQVPRLQMVLMNFPQFTVSV